MFFSRKKEEKTTPKKAEKTAAHQSPKKAKVRKEPPKQEEKKTQETATKAPAQPAPVQPPKPNDIKNKMSQGWLRAIIVFELAGKPREHIEQTMRAYIENIKTDGRVLSLKEDYADAIEHEDGIFSTFVEMEAIVEDLETCTWLAINFMPASIEVMEPESVTFEARHITNWYNDLLSKLHELSGILRQERSVNAHLTEAMNALIKNGLLSAVRDGEKTGKELQAMTGILEEQLEPFLKHLVEKGRLAKDDEKYKLP
jgi:hypothetical protein